MKLGLLGRATTVLGAVIVVGCSGASSSELFGQPASSEVPKEPEDEPSTSTPESSSPAKGSKGGGSKSSKDDGSKGDGSSGGSPDKTPPAASTILCGPIGPGGAKKTCQAKTEVCCVGWGPDAEFECEAASKLACVARTSIACDDGSDCPSGEVCCGSREDHTGYMKVECRPTCKDSPAMRAVQLCDPNAAQDECAPSGKECLPSDVLPGYHFCRG
jgi:hypothetical protein